MTVGTDPQCLFCDHFRSPFLGRSGDFSGEPTCAAFPEQIPGALLENEVDHRRPVEGDHGIRFQARAGEQFPAYAFDPAVLTP